MRIKTYAARVWLNGSYPKGDASALLGGMRTRRGRPYSHAVHRRYIPLAAATFLVLVVSALPLDAQSGRTPAGSSPALDQEPGVPPQPPALRPKWRQDLEERGITINIEDIYDFQGNPTGGRTQIGTVFGRSTAMLDVDLNRIAGWHGASLVVNGVFQTGANLAYTYVGAWDFTSSVAGTHTLRLNEYYLQQKLFENRLTLHAGQLAAQNEFDNQAIGFDDPVSAFKTWVNNTLCCNPPTTAQVYLSYTPAAKPGAILRADPNAHLFIKAGVFSATHSTYKGDESGLDFDLRNAPATAVTVGWKPGGEKSAHPGVYKIGAVENFGHYHRFNSKGITHGDQEYFFDAGQALWRTRNVNGDYELRGIDAQFSITAAPRELNVNDMETLGGLRFVGLLPHRKNDLAAVGVINAHFSRDWSRQLAAAGQPGRASQTNLEANYKFVVRKWISIWPNFQYVWKPSGDRRLDDTPIFGMRLVFDH